MSIIAVFILFICCRQAYSQETKHTIHLRNGDLSPVANATHWLDSFAAAPFKEPVQVLLHFNQKPTQQQKELLQQNGIDLVEYIPANTFTAILHRQLHAADIAGVPVHSIITPQPEWKADASLWKQVNAARGTVKVMVTFYTGIDAADIKKQVTILGGQIVPSGKENYGAYNINIAAAKLKSLAAWYGIKSISPCKDMVPLDYQNRAAEKANIPGNPSSLGGYGLLGDSVTIGIGDQSSGIYHADLRDRIINFNPNPDYHHGEHITGIVGSAGNVDPMAYGLCPHANMINHLFDFILPLSGNFFNDYNMTITNNSYAVSVGDCGYAGTYDGYAQLVDTLAIQYPQITDVFASANDGYLTCSPYLPGFATVSGGYQPAKNNIVVGSMTDFYVQRYDESRGPVKDGRLKPEMITIGWVVYSCIQYDGYEWAAGTSMASPGVAGGLGILTQRYKQLNHGQNPRGDVLKVLTLNGGLDLGNPGPDYSYGFGGLDIYKSLGMLNNSQYTTGAVNTGDSQVYSITVPAGTAQTKVMICWIDPPASIYAAKALVNDLDLTVTDPSGKVHYPLVLNPAPDSVNNNATEQPDHLNNVEQVIINTPVPGNYVIKVKGYDVPYPSQRFAIAWDFLSKNIQLTYPVGGESYDNTDSFRVFWDGVPDGNSYTVDFSADGGATWTTFSNNVPQSQWHYDTVLNNINSAHCMVKVINNGTGYTATSGQFLINTQPVVQLDTAQCPTYINIHWNKVPLATSYLVMAKMGPYMQVADSVTDTFYSYKNMPLNSNSYVAVCPIINGMRGYRSVSAIVMANTGDCSNPVSLGDLMLQQLLSPVNGRQYTSSAHTASDTLSLLIRNLYNSACDSYSVSYYINDGAWQTVTFTNPIPANGFTQVHIPGLNLANTGIYYLTAVVTNLRLADPLLQNDTLITTVLNIPNDSMNLFVQPFLDGFESMGIETVSNDSVGASPNGKWDFKTLDSFGRFRTFLLDGFAITGNRSVSMDNSRYVPAGTNNQFVGTFNLSGYDTALSEVRVDFDYAIYGVPKTTAGNIVETRANDQAPWSPFYNYNVNAYPGSVNHVQSISLTDALRASGMNFSSSTQLSFGQNDTSLICAIDYGNGITIDNVALYAVNNDAGIAGIVYPLASNCGLVNPVPLTIQVQNGVNYTLYNVQLFYTVDSGIVSTGIIDSIGPKATINYTFPGEMDLSAGLNHTLNVWLVETGDTYHQNDSILQFKFRNSPIVRSFPYLENFETGNGSYYSSGINDCWQYGKPASPKINKAASGSFAWKTNLTGDYNNLENSSLYSPCFDISGLSNPMLSFSTALDIENCGTTLCDQGYVEYSFDNITWTKLGTAGSGTNWYDSTFDIWNNEGFTRWHVASIQLPQPAAGDLLHLRFTLVSDPGGVYEGFAVDDIHIYDLDNPIFTSSVTHLDSGNYVGYEYMSDTINGQVIWSVNPNGQNFGVATTGLYHHDTLYNTGATQYTFPRNYAITVSNPLTDSVSVRLFITDSEIVQTLNDTTCPSCTPFTDAYALGITQYTNTNNPKCENGTLLDDTGGVFNFIHGYPAVQWIPYDQGYYAQFTTKPLSEFWFSNGGPTGNIPAGIPYVDFTAFRAGNDVKLCWYAPIDTAISRYSLLRSQDSVIFTDFMNINALHAVPGIYIKNDSEAYNKNTTWYYMLEWQIAATDSIMYSPVRKVNFEDTASQLVTFTAQLENSKDVMLSWTSDIDGITDHYILRRSVDAVSSKSTIGEYTTILNKNAVHNFGQQYSYTDIPGITGSGSYDIFYMLTAVLDDSSEVQMPLQEVKWFANNTLESVFPNPTRNGIFAINWYANTGTSLQIHITDEMGKVVFKGSALATQYFNTTTFGTGTHPAGIYYAYITIGGNKHVVKLVYE